MTASPSENATVKSPAHLRLPLFLRTNITFKAKRNVSKILRKGRLNTVCEEARCPNIGECFSKNTATFMIMGDRCTRRCHFCSVTTKKPLALDPFEPAQVADAALLMGLSYVVITSVDRDDLADYGAAHFANVVNKVKERLPDVKIELLTPDFRGQEELLDLVFKSPIDIFGHNIETIPRLYKKLRPQSDYDTSYSVLQYAAKESNALVKSGMMVGVGESDEEVFLNLKRLYECGVHIVTIGQYLRPSIKHWPVARYVSPETFRDYQSYGLSLGFRHVFAGPLVRSSYHAEESHRLSGG